MTSFRLSLTTEPRIAGASKALSRTRALAITGDRDSNVWVGTGDKLLRLNAGSASSPEEAGIGPTGAVNGLASDAVTSILESSDGTMWLERRCS